VSRRTQSEQNHSVITLGRQSLFPQPLLRQPRVLVRLVKHSPDEVIIIFYRHPEPALKATLGSRNLVSLAFAPGKFISVHPCVPLVPSLLLVLVFSTRLGDLLPVLLKPDVPFSRSLGDRP
jgi:hypothetical protein